jgi:hypothetical protein
MHDHDDDERGTPATPAPLETRRPDVPIDLNELAAQKDQAVEIIDARARVLQTLRKAAIGATSPEDWLLFKSPAEHGGQVVAYLQDCGADRVRDLYGIEIFNVSRPERIATNDPAIFHYLITGDGRCKLTRQTVVEIEGGRSSTDDFCRGKTGVELELAVRKAARANLDGSITRELAGLKSVPAAELEEVWSGTRKKITNCRLGRGFGTRDDRLGGNVAPDAGVAPPVCRLCQTPMQLRKGQRGNFYSCPNYRQHGKDSYTVDFDKWLEERRAGTSAAVTTSPSSAAAAATAPPASSHSSTSAAPPDRVTRELRDDEVFGNGGGGRQAPPANGRRQREPGEEG